MLDQIFYENEQKYVAPDMNQYQKVMDCFQSQISKSFQFPLGMSAQKRFKIIKDKFIYEQNCSEAFFKVLSEYQYDMVKEVKDVMVDLAFKENVTGNEISSAMRCPFIDEIRPTGIGSFQIISNQFGSFSFERADHYFRECDIVLNYIKTHQLLGNCHDHAFFLSAIFPRYELITSLCPCRFIGTYYHSYIYDKRMDKIIDLSCNLVLPKEDFDRMMKPAEVLKMPCSEVKKECVNLYKKQKMTSQKLPILQLALNQQIPFMRTYNDIPFRLR